MTVYAYQAKNLRFRPVVWDGKFVVAKVVMAINVARSLRGFGRKAN